MANVFQGEEKIMRSLELILENELEKVSPTILQLAFRNLPQFYLHDNALLFNEKN
jgi:hypothetical protein